MSLFLLSSNWTVLKDEYGSDYFYHPFADKAAFVDTLTNEKDKETQAMAMPIEEEVIKGSFCVEVMFANMPEEDIYYFSVSTNKGEKLIQRYKSNIKRKTDSPHWGEVFDVLIDNCRVMLFTVWKTSKYKPKVAGQCIFSIKQFCDYKYNRLLYKLNPAGELKFTIQRNSVNTLLRRRVDFSLCPEDDRVFGAPMIASEYTSYVPSFVVAAIQVIEQRGLRALGIYRVSGSALEVKKAQAEVVRACKNQKNLYHVLDPFDVNCTATLLKTFFRSLPSSLLGEVVFEGLGALLQGNSARETKLNEETAQILATIISGLDIINVSTAVFLFDHLLHVAEQGEANKMTISNLSIVFGPTLFPQTSGAMTMRSGLQGSATQGKIVAVILHNWPTIREIVIEKSSLLCGPEINR
ncbi:breakpoint cluster region protein-like [Zophobas morio]|jgi:hypothetical protein|uniref:breakpoint cluster region protein-like n=1 Tax=Zophobas morio TaxID=2755281 RepID=UPI003082E245